MKLLTLSLTSANQNSTKFYCMDLLEKGGSVNQSVLTYPLSMLLTWTQDFPFLHIKKLMLLLSVSKYIV